MKRFAFLCFCVLFLFVSPHGIAAQTVQIEVTATEEEIHDILSRHPDPGPEPEPIPEPVPEPDHPTIDIPNNPETQPEDQVLPITEDTQDVPVTNNEQKHEYQVIESIIASNNEPDNPSTNAPDIDGSITPGVIHDNDTSESETDIIDTETREPDDERTVMQDLKEFFEIINRKIWAAGIKENKIANVLLFLLILITILIALYYRKHNRK